MTSGKVFVLIFLGCKAAAGIPKISVQGTLPAGGSDVTTTGRACDNTAPQRRHAPEKKSTADSTIITALPSGDSSSSPAVAAIATAALFPPQEPQPREFPDLFGEARAGDVLEYQDGLDHANLLAQAKTLGTDDDVLHLTTSPHVDSGNEKDIMFDQRDVLEHGVFLHQTGQLQAAEKAYATLLQANPAHVDALRLLGIVRYNQATHLVGHKNESTDGGETETRRLFKEAQRLIWQAALCAEGEAGVLEVLGDLGEVLMTSGNTRDAEMILRSALRKNILPASAPHHRQMMFNLAVTLGELTGGTEALAGAPAGGTRQQQSHTDLFLEMEALLKRVVDGGPVDSLTFAALNKLVATASNAGDQASAVHWLNKTAELNPSHPGPLEDLAQVLKDSGRMAELRHVLNKLLELTNGSSDPSFAAARRNTLLKLAGLAADMGDKATAVAAYEDYLRVHPPNFVALNNLGAILVATPGREMEGFDHLEQATKIYPSHPAPLMNAALQRLDGGDLVQARDLYSRAYKMTADGGILVRMAQMLSPVAMSEEQMLEERESVVKEMARLTELHREGLISFPHRDKPAERAPFLVVYAGNNQRQTMEAITRMHASMAPELMGAAATLTTKGGEHSQKIATRGGEHHPDVGRFKRNSMDDVEDHVRPFQIGFVSTLFGEKEPHGMILEGMVLHLPRPRFRVTVCAVGGKVSRTLENGADEVARLPRTLAGARLGLEQLRLDALIFADTTCNAVLHLLTLARMAPIQAAFLGTPITSGSPAIDYYMSADALESPGRTIMTSEDDPYTEQVVLLGGQGIWYPAPVLPLELAPPPPPPPPPPSPPLPITPTFGAQQSDNNAAGAGGAGAAGAATAAEPQDLSEHTNSNNSAAGGDVEGALAPGRRIATTPTRVDRIGIAGPPPAPPPSEHGESEDTQLGGIRLLEQPGSVNITTEKGTNIDVDDAGCAPREQRRAVLRAELKDRLGVDQRSVVYMCAQSVFKLHPRFDAAVRGVLEASVSNHVVFTEGRDPRWTASFRERLRSNVGDQLMARVFFVPRTPQYFSLLASAEVALHPFPFGGSKTSADALAVGVPAVAMAGEFTFGRMAQSYYRTMGLEKICCIASDMASYVDLAARLGRDADFRNRVVDLIDQRQWALWERRDEVYEWAIFLTRIGGLSPLTPEEEAGLLKGVTVGVLPAAAPFALLAAQE